MMTNNQRLLRNVSVGYMFGIRNTKIIWFIWLFCSVCSAKLMADDGERWNYGIPGFA